VCLCTTCHSLRPCAAAPVQYMLLFFKLCAALCCALEHHVPGCHPRPQLRWTECLLLSMSSKIPSHANYWVNFLCLRSTYQSFCGNGLLKNAGLDSSLEGPITSPQEAVGRGGHLLQSAVCAKWLHPILATHYPRFSSFMLYGKAVRLERLKTWYVAHGLLLKKAHQV
jgi:hypothetical protein